MYVVDTRLSDYPPGGDILVEEGGVGENPFHCYTFQGEEERGGRERERKTSETLFFKP